MRQTKFYIAKMDCPTEEQLIRNHLERLEGIEQLGFNLMRGELTVSHRGDGAAAIEAALDAIGMEPKRIDPPAADGAPGATTPEKTRPAQLEPARVSRMTWVLLAISGAAALAAEIVALTTGEESSPLTIGLAFLSVAAGGRETLKKGWIAIKSFTLNINFLMSAAVLGALFIQQWPEAAMVTFLFAVAERIEARSLEHARNAIRGLMEMSPEMAQVGVGEGELREWRNIDAGSVKVGQVVRVKPGERIPLDGTVTAGQSTVNQAPITGESMPVEKTPGHKVFAGSVNELGVLEVTVTAAQGDTTLARIIRLIEEAQSERAPTQRFVDRFAKIYTPAVVAIAILVAVLPPLLLSAPFYPWLYRALTLLVIACPCALVISTPVAVVSGLAAGAKAGILIKGGVYLEQGHALKAVALDKTGTVTHGKPIVTDVVLLKGQTEREALELAASLDAHSEHPVASAIVTLWTRKRMSEDACSNGEATGCCPPKAQFLPVTEFASIPGRGVEGKIRGERYYVGNHRLMEEKGICSPVVEAEIERLEEEGKTTVVLASERDLIAVFGVADTLRETSVEAVQMLHRLGIAVVMLTGDNDKTGRAIAALVGIDDVRGNLLPEDKTTAVGKLLTKYGAVGMVGDGINDAPALAKASIGFAMGAAGTDTAIETADVALMQDDLRKLPAFIDLSRRTKRVLAQNIAFSIGVKVIFFGLALAGFATLWMAVFADMGASLLVVFNGLRLLHPPRGER
jgi:Cd2+/Zn2+-exporting ATPase